MEWADRALYAQPRMHGVIPIKAAAWGHLGRVEEGHEFVQRCRELRPGLTVARVKQGWGAFVSPEFLSVFVEGLRKAGLPEE